MYIYIYVYILWLANSQTYTGSSNTKTLNLQAKAVDPFLARPQATVSSLPAWQDCQQGLEAKAVSSRAQIGTPRSTKWLQASNILSRPRLKGLP